MPGKKKPKDLYEGYSLIPNTNIRSDNCPRVYFRVFVFECPCKNKKYCWWESPVSGAENGELCENPACKGKPPLRGVEIKCSTPISEEGWRVFGHFKCHKCDRFWCSAHSWTNTPQQCKVCEIYIFPFIQEPRGGFAGSKIKKNIEHATSLCGKCKEINGNCSKLQGKGNKGKKFRGNRRKKSRKNKKTATDAAGFASVLNAARACLSALQIN